MKIIDRDIYPAIAHSFGRRIITVLTGMRQTGKTTSLQWVKQSLVKGRLLSLNLDHFDIQTRLSSDPDTLVEDIESAVGTTLERFSPGRNKLCVLIDEVQKAPVLFDTIKWIHDDWNTKVKFVLSGSSSLDLYHRSSEALTGRVDILRLYPFSFWEALCFSRGPLSERFEWLETVLGGRMTTNFFREWTRSCRPLKRAFLEQFQAWLLYGLMPAVFHEETATTKWSILTNLRETYIERDIRPVRSVTNLVRFSTLLVLLANRTGRLMEISTLARNARMDHRTVTSYLGVLEATFLVFRLLPYLRNIEKRVVKSPKLYLVDTGIRNEVAGCFSLRLLESRGDLGKVMEQALLMQFIKKKEYARAPCRLYFHRTHGGGEIDLLIECEGGLIPMEIKKRGKRSPGRTMRRFMNDFAGQVPYGFLVSLEEDPAVLDGNIYRIAPWMLV